MNLNLATFCRLTHMRKVCGVLPSLENRRKIELWAKYHQVCGLVISKMKDQKPLK